MATKTAPEKILAVDDDESMLDIYSTGLRSAGYEVSTASSAKEAVERAAAEEFDLVITDLRMPGDYGGEEVVKRIKAARPKTELIVITGTPTLETAIATLKDGAYDYVFKPVVIAHLKSVVRRCLDHRRLREELSSERALRQELHTAYEELQKVEKLKEGILARLSHELKTPLFEIVMGLDIVKEGLATREFVTQLDKMKRTVDLAAQGCRRLERTLSNLLAFSEIGHTVPAVDTVPVDLKALCAGVVEGLRALWEPRKMSVLVEFPNDTPSVPGTPELLKKAFEHLIHNAILFSPQGGAIEIRARLSNGSVKVAISDKGEGIPESEFDHVFDSFYQVAHYLTRKVDGLGLGLAISRRIVEAHGGSIGVASQVAKGSTFTVSLPTGPIPA